MSGKRIALILAMALAVGLMGATKPRYGAWQTASRQTYGASRHDAVTRTVVFRLPGTAPTHSSYAALAAAADTVIIVPEDSLAIDEMRALYPSDGTPLQRYSRSWQGTTAGTWPPSTPSNMSWSVFRVPFERYIPDRSTVISAIMGIRPTVAVVSATDSLWAIADTLQSDWAWWSGNKTGRDKSPIYYGRRSASELNQRQNAHAAGTVATVGSGYCASCDSFRWEPPLLDRARSIDWGPRSVGLVFAGAVPDSASLTIDITRSVQYFVNGSRNNGIWLLLNSKSAAGTNYISFTVFGEGTRLTQKPFWSITYSNKEYSGVYPGGKEVAFSFCSDDGFVDANNAWADVYEARGLSYTIGISQAYFGDDNRATWADVVRWRNQGMEIASHSRRHKDYSGLCHWDSTSAGQDSLLMDIDPEWIYDGMATQGYATASEYADDRLVSKVMCLPIHAYSHRVVAKCDSMGYLALRTNGIGITALCALPGDTAAAYVGASAGRVFGISCPRKFNLAVVPYSYNTSDELYGKLNEPKISEALLRRRLRVCFEDQAVRGCNGWWLVFTHPLWSTPYTSGSGIDADQMDITLDELADKAWIAPMSDVSRYFRRNGTMYAHPTPWGTNDVWESRLGGATGPDRNVWYRGRFAQ